MSAGDVFAACEEAVRKHDPDRYFAALFAPEAQRRFLFALIAFYYELAHVLAAAREPMIADIRLAWWRETVEGARTGKVRDHVVAKALAETFAAHALPQDLFDRLIEGWAAVRDPFAGADALCENADARAGSLMRLCLLVVGGEAAVRDAAIAYTLAGWRSPAAEGLDCDAIARTHYAAARRQPIAKAALPVLMPAGLVPHYLRRADPPLWRKQLSYMRIAATGKL